MKPFFITAFLGTSLAMMCGIFGAVDISSAATAPTESSPGTIVATSIAEFGAPLYAAMPDHMPYADPKGVKGGAIVLGANGSFDSLNTYLLRSETPAGIGMIDDTLMTGSADELATAYALIAQSVEYPADKSQAVFTIDSRAKWQDGAPIVAADFVAALDAIRKSDVAFMQAFFSEVDQASAPDDHHVKFTFKTRDSMKPILAVATSLPPLPRQFWKTHDITKSLMEPRLGSGPYRVSAIDPGRSITYQRVKDYWAADLPILRGQENFDAIRYDYYLDDSVLFEAFKAHKIDFRLENKASRWVRDYDIAQVRDGQIVVRAIHEDMPQGVQGLFFNLRRPQFADARVRHALNYLFDFETTQRNLLNGKYKRDTSYFPGSDYGAAGLPEGRELELLEPFRAKLPPELFTQPFIPPKTDGSGNIRANLKAAIELFQQAGWKVEAGRLIDGAGKQMKIEILLDNATFERVIQPYVDNLRRAGIEAGIRTVDTAQYQHRLQDFDFDAIELKSNFFPPPGTELRSYYGSATADKQGTGNWSGIKDPVADSIIETIIAAKDLDTLKAATRALDRVLSWQYYCVPEWYNDEAWLAYWDRFRYPAKTPRYGTGFPDTWWIGAAVPAAP